MTAGRCSQGGDVCILEKATVPSSDLEISYAHPRGIVASSCSWNQSIHSKFLTLVKSQFWQAQECIVWSVISNITKQLRGREHSQIHSKLFNVSFATKKILTTCTQKWLLHLYVQLVWDCVEAHAAGPTGNPHSLHLQLQISPHWQDQLMAIPAMGPAGVMVVFSIAAWLIPNPLFP